MAAKTAWAAFPHDAKGFAFAGDALRKAWPKLHAGDLEPFPDTARAAQLIVDAGKAAPKGVDADALATTLQEALARVPSRRIQSGLRRRRETRPGRRVGGGQGDRHPRHPPGR